ncbi:GGDEF domain-containing protein [Alteromonas pelagimontana]|uniref:diguanylate cyclase n=1 Tax=Alteromonas pelagimontana TaxID=1858656 RepID=A0A6M4MK43_9ALTE|nr:GGDEF domain-containing protein [Alteromonas pelagimontana]QJR82456.1 GGDEF domain-containing protein [Alteromonas pelagimontana]
MPKYLIGLLCVVWLQVTFASGASLLEQSDKLRLSDTQKALTLFMQIERQGLSPQEKLHYRYLEAYFSTFEGDLQRTLSLYRELLDEVPASSPLKVRILTSMLGIASYSEQWGVSVELAEQLDAMLAHIADTKVLIDAYKGLLIFYNSTEQARMALTYAEKILASPDITVEQRCFALTMQNEIVVRESNTSEKQFSRAITICEAAEQPYYVASNYVHLFSFYVQNGNINKARMIFEDTQSQVEALDVAFLQSSFFAAESKFHLAMNELDMARKTSFAVISLDKAGQFLPPKIEAYKVLVEVAKQKGEYERALTLLEKQNSLKETLHSERVVKALALQQAKYDLKAKENEIALLDKKNKLLGTESDLRRQQIESALLALVFTSITVIGLLCWTYRSRKIQHRLKVLATTDSLTGCANRGYFSDIATKVLKTASRQGSPVCMLLLDLDYFKRVNDNYGHQVGDWVLREVVNAINTVSDKNCTLGRMGGEEFGMLITDADVKEGLVFAEQCREAIEMIDSSVSGHSFSVSASFGVSDTRQVGYNLDNLFSAADLALYQSKKYGRNQVYEYDQHLYSGT